MTEKGKVSLVGAGPGDPELITVKGVEAIKRADVVVYDYLASPDLLCHAQLGAEAIYVGKRAGQHTMRQTEINALLVGLALAGKDVVRLKGGDPFVFGRGGEEAEALVAAGVPFEVVPGISSAIAAAAYAGIPVTHRGVASSFAVVTGHEDPTKKQGSIDWDALSRIDTLVVLMGVGRLPHVVEELVSRGRESQTPVALVEWGTTGRQRTVVGTLADIVQRVERAGLQPPAVTIVGQVVALRQKLRWFDSMPLHGLRVLVTRTRTQASRLSSLLRSLGAEPVECPLIETCAPSDWTALDGAILDLARPAAKPYDWIAFTSANAMTAFFQRLSLAGLDSRALSGVKIAAIGPATGEALAQHGLRADLVPDRHVAEALAEELGAVDGLRVLFPKADIGRPTLTLRLKEAGAHVQEVVAYRTVQPEGLETRLQALLPGVDVVTFASSSAVRHFVQAIGSQSLETMQDKTVACIGPITAETARAAGLQPKVVAENHTIEGLAQSLLEWHVAQRDEVK